MPLRTKDSELQILGDGDGGNKLQSAFYRKWSLTIIIWGIEEY